MTSCLCFCCSYGNGSVFSSLPLPCFVHILAEMATVKTFEFYAANCSKPNGAKKRQKKKKRTVTHRFFLKKKKHWVKFGYVSKSCNAADPPPTKTQQKQDFDPLFFFDKKGYMCPAFHASSTQSIRPDTTHISPADPPATHLPEGDQHAPKPGQGGFEPPTPKHRSRIA